MEEKRKEQKEALEVLEEFNGRLVKNVGILVKELSGQRLEDTDKFLKSIIDAMNWEVQVVNGTLDMLNEGKERVNKEDFNTKMVALSDAIATKEDRKMADAFQAVLPVFENLGNAAKEVVA